MTMWSRCLLVRHILKCKQGQKLLNTKNLYHQTGWRICHPSLVSEVSAFLHKMLKRVSQKPVMLKWTLHIPDFLFWCITVLTGKDSRERKWGQMMHRKVVWGRLKPRSLQKPHLVKPGELWRHPVISLCSQSLLFSEHWESVNMS